MLSAEGEPVDWDTVLAAKEVQQQNPDEGFAAEGFAAAAAAAKDPQEAPSDFEASLRELEETWKRAHANGEIDAEELGLFQSIFKSEDMERILEQDPKERIEEMFDVSMGDATEGEEALLGFSRENPYLGSGEGLEAANKLIKEGKLQQAVWVLEAEVQKNPSSSEGWRLLGQCHADREQDVEAIHCLKKGHSVDPYNLDSLMALGVSLTNELDVSQALLYLRTWLTNHDDFQNLPGLSERPPEDFHLLKAELVSLFEAALQQPEAAAAAAAAELHSALGVLYNIDRHYDEALLHLAEALKHAKEEAVASLWNKIGATLANSGRSAAALVAYSQTLKLKPNYPRAWTNLGVAKANLGQMEEALQHYLVALELNPAATHLWYYIRSALISLSN
ncbi:TPR domain-containing protein, putative [Eimeria tenella]|uniref:TPR domain-containing protein, putative n=1 Tax=Eimeria tenella TaxID=5802 RepID=U6L6L2_EIMTE|nr:TPR domain-containing protein, putative [Eimeria tenella]CDJ44843.1 TPR domain-containing protein, putative [Eimeria tenella]|eukprot:XP_013235591.1 TPR domain-containing protein, putative [Eimeria tenella]